MFLLAINHANMSDTIKELPNLPEFTLWETFSEAVEVAFETAAECGVCIDMEEAEIDFSKGMCFLPEFCDIMPITISTKDRLTWLGKEWKKV